MPADLRPVVDLLAAAPEILLTTHEKPDPDALGSALGLALGLEALGKRVQVACADPVPQRVAFLPTAERVTATPQPAPLGIIVDAGEPSRLGALEAVLTQCRQIAVIDHHPKPRFTGAAEYLDDTAAAAALLVLDVLRALGASVTPEIATCLFAGLAGDTGHFAYQNTDERALRAAADLVAAGANPYEIHRHSAAQFSLPALHLRGCGLLGVRARVEGRLVYSVLRERDFAETGALEEDTEGIVDLLKGAHGGEVFVLFKQAEEAKWRVSFRSERLDVGEVARELGGGGHAVAAGCELFGSEESITERVLPRLEELLREGR
jgi:bifunctional oligoribonuclease and PAP phosphatase NrnA